MKKHFYVIMAGLSLAFTACHQNDDNYGRFDNADPSSGWVQYSDGGSVQFIYGTSSTISLPVELHAPVNAEGLDVTYTITDVAGNSSTIIPQRTGTFTITSEDQINEVSANGQIRYMLTDLLIPVNDSGLSQSVEFDVALTATSKSEVQIGLSDNSKPTVVRVKICAVNIGTTYAGTAVSSTGFVGPDFTQTLVPVDGNPRQFTTASAWGVLFVPTLANNPAAIRDYPAIITINDDYTVTVVGINTPTAPNRYPGGEGTYDPCTDTFNITLRQGVFTTPFTVDVTYSPVGAN